MSEQSTHGSDSLIDQNRWYVDKLFIEDYQFLEGHFPHSVHKQDSIIDFNGRRAHEFIFSVGEPMEASDVFGSGRSLEVGGPSDYSELRTVKGALRPSIITNIDPTAGADELADATKLHYPDSSFRAVLAKGLPGRQRAKDARNGTVNVNSAFIHEAYRVLEPGGMILMCRATKEDLAEALELGFALELGNGCVISRLAAIEDVATSPRLDWDISTPLTYMDMEFLLHK